MSLLHAAACLGAVLEHDELLAARLAHDLGADRGAIDHRPTDRSVIAVGDEQHPIEAHGLAGLDIEQLDFEFGADLDAVLLPAGLDDCVHGSSVVMGGGRRGRPHSGHGKTPGRAEARTQSVRPNDSWVNRPMRDASRAGPSPQRGTGPGMDGPTPRAPRRNAAARLRPDSGALSLSDTDLRQRLVVDHPIDHGRRSGDANLHVCADRVSGADTSPPVRQARVECVSGADTAPEPRALGQGSKPRTRRGRPFEWTDR